MSATNSPTVNELTAKMLEKHREWKGLVEKGPEMTADDLGKIPGVKAEYLDFKGQVDRFNAVSAHAGEVRAEEDYLRKPDRHVPHPSAKDAGGPAGGARVVDSYESGYAEVEYRDGRATLADDVGEGSIGTKQWRTIQKPEYKAAFKDWIRRKCNKEFMGAVERKTLEEGLDDQGGYLVPVDVLLNRIVQRKPTPTRIAPMCANMNTSREVVEMLKVNYATDNIYTTGFRVTKTGETPTSATQMRVTDTNLFGTIKIPVHTFMISAPVTMNMVEDAAFDPIAWLGDKFGETIEILKDDKVLNGTGRMEPFGILTAAASTSGGQGTDDPKVSVVYSGDANTVTPDGLMDLALDVPEQYEDGCRFVFNKVSTFRAIRKLKDLNDRYLFGAGVQESGLAVPTRPTDLIGYPFTYSGLMPNTSANAYPIIFGDLQGYQVVNRIGFSVRVLSEVYAESGYIVLLGRYRFGGQVIEPWRLRTQQIHA